MSFASSFAAGQKVGNGLVGTYNTAMDQQRQQVLDDRATEEYGQKQDAVKRQLGIQAKTDEARTRIEGLNGGVFEGSQANFGINDGVAPQGPMPKEAYQAPSVGLQPRKATDRELNRAYQSEALARGDMAAAAGMQAKDRGYGVQEVSDTAAKTPMADIRKSLGNLNIGEMTGMPISYVGEKTDSKGKPSGYKFVTYDAQGTPSPFTLNEDQLRQMHLGSQLSAAGYGEESHKVMSAINKEAADHVKDYNDSNIKVSTANNTAQYYSDNREIQRDALAANTSYQNRSLGIQAAKASGDDKKIPAAMNAEINGLIAKLNDSKDPAEQRELNRQLTNKQIGVANFQGKPYVPKEARPSVNPKDYMTSLKAAVESGAYATPQDARMAIDTMYGVGISSQTGTKSGPDPFVVANTNNQPKPAAKGLVQQSPQPEPYAGAGAPPQYIFGGRGGVVKMENPQYKQWLFQNGLGIPQMPTGNVIPYDQD